VYSSLAAFAALSVAFVLDGLKTTNQSRHDVYEDGVFFFSRVVSGKGISGHFIG
jgi:hypothetical protein